MGRTAATAAAPDGGGPVVWEVVREDGSLLEGVRASDALVFESLCGCVGPGCGGIVGATIERGRARPGGAVLVYVRVKNAS